MNRVLALERLRLQIYFAIVLALHAGGDFLYHTERSLIIYGEIAGILLSVIGICVFLWKTRDVLANRDIEVENPIQISEASALRSADPGVILYMAMFPFLSLWGRWHDLISATSLIAMSWRIAYVLFLPVYIQFIGERARHIPWKAVASQRVW